MKKTYLVVIIMVCIFVFMPNSALAADSYDGAGAVVIDTNPGINLQTSVEAALLLEGSGHSASHITHLTITDDVTYTLTSDDLNYIANFLHSMTHLNVASTVTVDANGDSTLGDVGNYFFVYNDTIEHVTFPGEIFGFDCFFECLMLESVDLPFAKEFGDYCFVGNTTHMDSELTNVNLPLAAKFGDGAFLFCFKLETINLPSAEEFGFGAFMDCIRLENATLPKAKTFGTYAFADCIELDTISLPSAATFDSNAFTSCIELDSVDLPKITSIGENIFQGCSQPIDMTFGSEVPTLSAANQFGNMPLAAGSVLNVPDTAYNLYDNDSADTLGSANDNLWFTWPLKAIITPPAKNPSTGDFNIDFDKNY